MAQDFVLAAFGKAGLTRDLLLFGWDVYHIIYYDLYKLKLS